jgi:hypothetical protein
MGVIGVTTRGKKCEKVVYHNENLWVYTTENTPFSSW